MTRRRTEIRLLRGLTASAVGLLGVLGIVTAASADDGAESGRMLFFSQGCYGCHRVGMAGTPIAYDLSHIGTKYTEPQLAQWLRDPASQKPSSHMPRLTLQEEEISALAAYLATLR